MDIFTQSQLMGCEAKSAQELLGKVSSPSCKRHVEGIVPLPQQAKAGGAQRESPRALGKVTELLNCPWNHLALNFFVKIISFLVLLLKPLWVGFFITCSQKHANRYTVFAFCFYLPSALWVSSLASFLPLSPGCSGSQDLLETTCVNLSPLFF